MFQSLGVYTVYALNLCNFIFLLEGCKFRRRTRWEILVNMLRCNIVSYFAKIEATLGSFQSITLYHIYNLHIYYFFLNNLSIREGRGDGWRGETQILGSALVEWLLKTVTIWKIKEFEVISKLVFKYARKFWSCLFKTPHRAMFKNTFRLQDMWYCLI